MTTENTVPTAIERHSALLNVALHAIQESIKSAQSFAASPAAIQNAGVPLSTGASAITAGAGRSHFEAEINELILEDIRRNGPIAQAINRITGTHRGHSYIPRTQ